MQHPTYQKEIDAFLDLVKSKNPNEPEFLQAVEEVAFYVIPYISLMCNVRDLVSN